MQAQAGRTALGDQMTGAISAFGSEFDAFLFAPIWDDHGNGMQLSVLSALARLNIDPWEEAARLALMSSEAATGKMAAWIAALAEGNPMRPDAGPIAVRLIALLPRGVNSTRRVGATKTFDPSSTVQFWPLPRVIIFVVSLALVLLAQWFVSSHLTKEFAGHGAGAPAATTPAPGVSKRGLAAKKAS